MCAAAVVVVKRSGEREQGENERQALHGRRYGLVMRQGVSYLRNHLFLSHGRLRIRHTECTLPSPDHLRTSENTPCIHQETRRNITRTILPHRTIRTVPRCLPRETKTQTETKLGRRWYREMVRHSIHTTLTANILHREHRPFTNSARSDALQLSHWVKLSDPTGGRSRSSSLMHALPSVQTIPLQSTMYRQSHSTTLRTSTPVSWRVRPTRPPLAPSHHRSQTANGQRKKQTICST